MARKKRVSTKGRGKSKARRFDAVEGKSKAELRSILERMGVGDTYDIKEYADTTCRVAFERDGKEYHFICDEFNNHPDNLRACGKAIEFIFRAYEDYCVRTSDVPREFGTIFSGFRVTEGQKVLAISDGKKPCWVVLGLQRDSTKTEIRSRYKVLAREHHPDQGGDAEEFKRINTATEEFLEMRS